MLALILLICAVQASTTLELVITTPNAIINLYMIDTDVESLNDYNSTLNNIVISYNEILTNIVFNSLQSVTGDIQITNNVVLRSINAQLLVNVGNVLCYHTIVYCNYSLIVENNTQLASVNVPELSFISKDLVFNNNALTQLTFSSLTYIAGNFNVTNDDSITLINILSIFVYCGNISFINLIEVKSINMIIRYNPYITNFGIINLIDLYELTSFSSGTAGCVGCCASVQKAINIINCYNLEYNTSYQNIDDTNINIATYGFTSGIEIYNNFIDQNLNVISSCQGGGNGNIILYNTYILQLTIDFTNGNIDNVDIEHNTKLITINMPGLQYVNGYFILSDNNNIQILTVGGLVTINYLNIYNNYNLTSIQLPSVTTLNEGYISSNTNLIGVDLVSLTNTQCLANLHVCNNPLISDYLCQNITTSTIMSSYTSTDTVKTTTILSSTLTYATTLTTILTYATTLMTTTTPTTTTTSISTTTSTTNDILYQINEKINIIGYTVAGIAAFIIFTMIYLCCRLYCVRNKYKSVETVPDDVVLINV